MITNLGFIGGGHMTNSLIQGLVNAGSANSSIDEKNIFVFDRNPEKLAQLASDYGVQVASSNEDLIANTDALVLSIKPQALEQSLLALTESINDHQPFLISVAAGIRSDSINHWLGGGFSICRAMPNMGSAVGLGATGIFANEFCSDQQKEFACSIMDAAGISVWVNQETDIDSVTALSGSGPAYFMLFIKHLIDSAVNSGLDENSAKRLALQTARGAIDLISSSDKDISQLVDSICLAGGTTERAVASFSKDNLGAIVDSAFCAAKNRATQLAADLSHK